MNTVDKVIKIAEGEIGYLEKSAVAYRKNPKVLDSKTEGAGSDNYTKYGRDMHKVYPEVMDFPAAWCDCFVDWCFYMAYGVSTAKSLLDGNFQDYTPLSAEMYKKHNAYIKRGEGKPKRGDQIFFRNSERICHTGIVYKVDNTYVYTIEGNTSGASGVIANGGGVKKKQYYLTSTYIDGYGRPKYDEEPDGDKVKKKPRVAKPTLRPAMVNSEVRVLQRDLNWTKSRDENGNKLAIDGEFGKHTKAAMMNFQKTHKEANGKHLEVDGIYGPKSYAAMDNAIA